MCAGAVVACLVLPVLAQATAVAAPADEADALVRRGIELRKAFKDREALDQFQRANQLAPTPRTEAQMGMAEQALGRWVDADAHITEALRAGRDTWIAKNRGVLEQALTMMQSHLGKLDVIANPPGTEIRVDGRDVGRAPLSDPVRVPVGSVIVELRAPGYFPATRTVLIAAAQLTRETISLQPMRASEQSGSSPASGREAAAAATVKSADSENAAGTGDTAPSSMAAGNSSSAPSQADPRSIEVAAGEGGPWRRRLAWTLAAGAVVFAGGGVGALIVRDGKASDYNHLLDTGGCSGSNGATCAGLRSDGDRARTLAIVGFSVAGIMAITSTVLFLTMPSNARPSLTALGRCGPGGLAATLTCVFTF